MDKIGKQIAKDIDEEVMSNILTESGWTPVNFHFKDNYHANDVNFWLLEHCSDRWLRLGSDYLFKDVKEAEWFILKWV